MHLSFLIRNYQVQIVFELLSWQCWILHKGSRYCSATVFLVCTEQDDIPCYPSGEFFSFTFVSVKKFCFPCTGKICEQKPL